MKKIFQRASLALLVASSVSVANAADFDIKAEFVNDVTLNSTADMDFGQLAVSTPTGTGTAVLAADGSGVSVTGQVVSVDATNAVPAAVEVTSVGGGNAALTIASATLNGTLGGSLTVDTFTFSSTSGTTNVIAVGAGATESVSIGATLNVPANTAVDTYTGTATVTAAMQ